MHADPRGTPEFNLKLSERRVARAEAFLVEQGVPEASIDTKAEGEEKQLSKDEVKDLIQSNPDLTDEQRTKLLNNLNVIVLAQNRRVDIRLNGSEEKSSRHYPFNAADSDASGCSEAGSQEGSQEVSDELSGRACTGQCRRRVITPRPFLHLFPENICSGVFIGMNIRFGNHGIGGKPCLR